jgi:hypothetical protein
MYGARRRCLCLFPPRDAADERALQSHRRVGVPLPVRRARVADHHVGDRDPPLRVRGIVDLLALDRRLPVAARPEGADVGAPIIGRLSSGAGGARTRDQRIMRVPHWALVIHGR